MKVLSVLSLLVSSLATLVFLSQGSAQEKSVTAPNYERAGRSTADGIRPATAEPPAVTEPPDSFFAKYRDDIQDTARRFYKKYLSICGISVAASADVANEALQRTYSIVTHMLAGRPDILETMAKAGTRLIIIGKDQVYTQMPEYRNARNPQYLNERVRGTGGFDVCSFGEENLLNLAADRYDDESIGVHEFSHTIDAALRRMDPEFCRRLNLNFTTAVAKGLWRKTYAGSNPAEYWAETVTMYFDCERANNWNHGPIISREQLKIYDPDQYAFIRQTFNLKPENDWRYRPLRTQPSIVPPPAKFKIDCYYTKFTYAREFPIIGSNRVSDEALLKANDTVRKMFAYRYDILKAMIDDGARLLVLGANETLADLPEFKRFKSTAGFDDARYLDYTPKLKLMIVPEENVLGLPKEPFAGECMVVNVFAKGLCQVAGLRPVDPEFARRREKQQYELRVKRLDEEFDHRLKKNYDDAMERGLWKGTPSARDRREYWAAGVEAYFDAAGAGVPPNGADRPVTSRELLQRYDPALYLLVDETMAYSEHVDWRFQPYSGPAGVNLACRDVADSMPAATQSAQARPVQELPVQPRRRRSEASMAGSYKARIVPNWFHGNTRFWYRNDLRGGTRKFVVVDAEAGTRQPAFDHQRLAAALSKAAGVHYGAEELPFDFIEFLDDAKSIRFTAGGATWTCDLGSYDCVKTASTPGSAKSTSLNVDPGDKRQPRDEAALLTLAGNDDSPADRDGSPAVATESPAEQSAPTSRAGVSVSRGRSVRSPDGKWTAFIREHNVFVAAESGGKEIQLSADGKAGLAYGKLQWAPDSASLVAYRIEPGDNKEVFRIESSPQGGGRAVLHSRPYPLPGDKFTTYELNVFTLADQKQIKPKVDRVDMDEPVLRWKPDGCHFTYLKVDRGHQHLRVIEVDSHTGAARNLIDETTRTFIWTAHTEGLKFKPVNYLERSDEIIYVSEKDGWRHLYLIDAKAGEIKIQMTRGQWIIRGIDKIDEEKRQVWFQASGVYPDQDPYLIHYGRVNFDGSGLVFLTAGNGSHSIAYSPDRKYLIDTFSRVDMPPAHELRRVEDGKLVCELETADASDADWQPPEVFVAKGRDGQTDIWGLLFRPKNLDPSKRYPILEDIYAGPQGSFVPKTFGPGNRYVSLTQLGFIVVKIDGMGTANRSKAFHDVCWHNLKDAGFPDRILWIKAAAAKYPYMDLSRVGIYGTSAGGQSAAGAILFHPEFYKAAVANSGCHDNRMDKSSWNEQWMGYPVGPWYSECSNIDNAAKLQGHLMLIVGEMDDNVPPESTYRFVDALIKAQKDFELLVVPGGGHGAGGAYGQRRLQDFFVRHLQGIEPANRNAAVASTSN
ncbi:MAG: prolyl oligopeptidase family serine peptidase [Thermoguttaceae bacterium]